MVVASASSSSSLLIGIVRRRCDWAAFVEAEAMFFNVGMMMAAVCLFVARLLCCSYYCR